MKESRRFALLMVGALILTVAACNGDDPGRPQPVRGKVFFRDRPAEGARVTFVPQGGNDPRAARPTAAVERDGTFRLSTRSSYDGAPAGRYAVTVVYRSPTKKVDDENAGPDLLDGKYRDPKTTPLRADVKAGENELEPFRLK
jgi:hypothetical protein